MNQSQKLNLFVGLGCKPMKDVILNGDCVEHCPLASLNTLEEDRVLITSNPYTCIEAIPERLTDIEILANVYNIETKDYEICAGKYVRGEL